MTTMVEPAIVVVVSCEAGAAERILNGVAGRDLNVKSLFNYRNDRMSWQSAGDTFETWKVIDKLGLGK